MALKSKSNDTDESSDDEDSKMKSYITRRFKKFMKNANVKERKMLGTAVSTLFPLDQNASVVKILDI